MRSASRRFGSVASPYSIATGPSSGLFRKNFFSSVASPYSIATGASSGSLRRKFTILDLQRLKKKNQPITMVTAYDASSAQHAEAAGVDIILVGDSAANVIHGMSSTCGISMDQMVAHAASVCRQSSQSLVVGDLPFGSYVNVDQAVANSVRLIQAGCDAVKLEGGRRVAHIIKAVRQAGIAVFGHVGVTPQTVSDQGGFKSQGRDLASAWQVIDDCLALEEAGVCCIVLEMVTTEVSSLVTRMLQKTPTIGIGSGLCNGQVLVYHDMLGLLQGGHNPRFAKKFAHLGEIAIRGLQDYRREVLAGEFPKRMHTFATPPGVMREVLAKLEMERIVIPSEDDSNSSASRIRSVVVIGGGAMGSLFAARLAHVASVTLLSSHHEHLEAINRSKLVVQSEEWGTLSATIQTAASVEQVQQTLSEPPDLIILLVKSRDTVRAAAQAAALMGPNTILCSLQNGVGHYEKIQVAVGGTSRIVLGTTSMAGTLPATLHGQVLHRGSGPTSLGPAGWSLYASASLTNEEFAKGLALSRRVRDLLELAGLDARVALDDQDFRNIVFQKLLVNSVVNPLTALHRVRNGQLLTVQYLPIVEALTSETACILRLAEGFQMADPLAEIKRVLTATAKNQSSMLSDVLRKAEPEVDVLNGTIVKMAKRIGAPAPLNRSMIRRVSNLARNYHRTFSTASFHLADSVDAMRTLRRSFDSSTSIGFVPTMGGLHQGHLNLVEQASAENDVVVVSIYVNPTQFGPSEDFHAYPRRLQDDVNALKGLHIDKRIVVFAPSDSLFSPEAICWVTPVGLDTHGEGACRPGHFRGVATVVLKLFNIVEPNVAYFGQKDGQQCILVRALVRDLDMLRPKIKICPTAREASGLAMSTRNQYLSEEQRLKAPILSQILLQCERLIMEGKLSTPREVKLHFKSRLDELRGAVTLQYISLSSAASGRELDDECSLAHGETMLAAAIGFPGTKLRLLDNVVVSRD